MMVTKVEHAFENNTEINKEKLKQKRMRQNEKRARKKLKSDKVFLL